MRVFFTERQGNCAQCGKEYVRDRKERRFCSVSCSRIALPGRFNKKRTGKVVECTSCGKKTYKAKVHIDTSKRYFCSRSCAGVGKRDEPFVKWLKNKRNVMRKAAPKRGFEFSLSMEELQEIFKKDAKCFYCEEKLKIGGSKPNSITIERVRSKDGYVSGNVVAACRLCNTIKNLFDPVSHKERTKKILDKLGYKYSIPHEISF